MRVFVILAVSLLYAVGNCKCAPRGADVDAKQSDGDLPPDEQRSGGGDSHLKPLIFPEKYDFTRAEDLDIVFQKLSIKFFVTVPRSKTKSVFRTVWGCYPSWITGGGEFRDACETRRGVNGVTLNGWVKCNEKCDKMNEKYVNYINDEVLQWMVKLSARVNGIRVRLRAVSEGNAWCDQVKGQNRYKCKCAHNFEILVNSMFQDLFDRVLGGNLEKDISSAFFPSFLPKLIGFVVVLKVNVLLFPVYLCWLCGVKLKNMCGYYKRTRLVPVYRPVAARRRPNLAAGFGPERDANSRHRRASRFGGDTGLDPYFVQNDQTEAFDYGAAMEYAPGSLPEYVNGATAGSGAELTTATSDSNEDSGCCNDGGCCGDWSNCCRRNKNSSATTIDTSTNACSDLRCDNWEFTFV